MSKIPKLLKKTKSIRRIQDYMNQEFTEIRHTTLNPAGPGCIRMHLIPPMLDSEELNQSVVIVNGTDIIPVNFLWTIILAELIKHVNKYDGSAISEEELAKIMTNTVESVKAIVPLISRKKIAADIQTIYTTMKQIAFREEVTTPIEHINIGDYADYMNAPHRMDVMVSAMTKNGTWHCNQKCVHCYAASQNHSDEEELSTEDWKKILDKCRSVGIPQVTFTGGEPTMREDLFELIEYARWFISRLNTNGIKLTPEYCQKLKAADIDSVQITFYSSDPEVHNALVGAPQFENTAKGIENALNAGLAISINTPLCTINKDYVKTLEYLHDKGVIYVTCSGLITTGNALGEDSVNLQLTSGELEQILREAVSYCNANGMEIAFTSPGWIEEEVFAQLNISSPSCGAGLSNMAITPGGNVVPCQSWLSDKALGNMLEDDWNEIWNSEECRIRRNYSAALTGKCPLRRNCI